MKWVLLICASPLALFAQTIEVSSESASPGERATVVISIHSTKTSDILGLQWETTFSARQMTIEDGGSAASDATKATGKSLTCAGKAAKEADRYSYTCILIGGQKQIKSGPIAIFNFHISPKAKLGSTPVRVGRAQAVTKNLQKISLRDAEGVVIVKTLNPKGRNMH